MAAKAMKTISPTGKARPDVDRPAHLDRTRAFTLVELILVMALLGIVLAIGAPALGRFFQGRTLDSEARRFLGLTHYAQNRAVSEGVPMVLWIDPEERAYGLHAETSYEDDDKRALRFGLAEGITIETDTAPATLSYPATATWRQTQVLSRNRPALRFTPDGFIDPTSPERIAIQEDNLGLVRIGQSRNRLHYEIQTNTPTYLPR
jgi:prepilin-type N-terminal cleavage/methylation domain-containing protein